MDIQNVFSNSVQFIPKLSKHMDAVIAIQRVIKAINGRHRGIRDTKKIITAVVPYVSTFTFAAAGKTINDDLLGNFTTLGFTAGDKLWFSGDGALNIIEMTIVSIQNDAATNDQITVSEVIVNDAAISGTLAGFTLLSGYSYNHLTGEIELSTTVKETIEIFSDGYELDVKDYDNVNIEQQLLTYASISRRKFIISPDIYGTDIEILAWFDLPNISATVQGTLVDVPIDYEDIIQDGVIYYLTSMPQYKDEFLNGESKEKFYSGIQLLKDEQAVAFHTPRRKQREIY